MDPGDVSDDNLADVVATLDQFSVDGFRRSYILNDDWILKVARDKEVSGYWPDEPRLINGVMAVPSPPRTGAGILANQREIIRATAVGDVAAAAIFAGSVKNRWLAMERPTTTVWDATVADLASRHSQLAGYSSTRYIVNAKQLGIMGDARTAMIDLGYGPINSLNA